MKRLFPFLLLASSLSAQTVPQAAWKLVFADSANAGYPATNAFDGNVATFWHTDFSTTNPPLPHEIQIDLGAVYSLTGFSYEPRQDLQINGDVTQYSFYVSTDLSQPWTSVSSGTMAMAPCGGATTTKTFPAVNARYIRLQAMASCNGNWMNVAELNVIGTLAAPPQPPVSLNLTTKLVWCSLCDRTDDIPMQGSLGIQQNGVSDSFTFAADGSVSVNLSIDMSADPVTFTVFLTDANGNQAQGSGWTWSFPRASVKAGVASIGTFKFGGLAFTKNSDGSVSFAGFL